MQSSFRTENFQLGIVYYCNLAVSDGLLFINIKPPIERIALSAVAVVRIYNVFCIFHPRELPHTEG